MTLTLTLALGIGIIAALLVVAIALFMTRRTPAPVAEPSGVPNELNVRRGTLQQRLGDILERIPRRAPLAASEVPDHPRAGHIEARLLSGNARGALLEAEELLLREPSDPRVHVLLARALMHCDEAGAASRELVRARRLGAVGPMLVYLEARIQHRHLQKHTQFSKGDHKYISSSRDLITPFEMFMLELDRQRKQSEQAFADWLASTSTDPNREPADREDIMALLTEHFSAYYDCLDKLLSAVEHEPAFTDALYHLARMALKVGLVVEGLAVMEKIEPLMFASPEKRDYDRDLSRLRTERNTSFQTPLATRLDDIRASQSNPPD